MNARQRLTADTTKSIAHAADMLLFDAKELRRAATTLDSYALRHSVEQRLMALRKTLDVVADELAALKILEKV